MKTRELLRLMTGVPSSVLPTSIVLIGKPSSPVSLSNFVRSTPIPNATVSRNPYRMIQ